MFALTIRNEAATIVSDDSEFEALAHGETFDALLAPGRGDLSPRMARLRDQILTVVGDFGEYRRILMGGRGDFHEAFLRELLYGSNPIRPAYKRLYALSLRIPQEIFLKAQVLPLPTWEEIENLIPKERRRAP